MFLYYVIFDVFANWNKERVQIKGGKYESKIRQKQMKVKKKGKWMWYEPRLREATQM